MSMHRVIAVFGHSEDPIHLWIPAARVFVAAVAADPATFANPSPTCAAVTAAIDDAANADAEAKKTRGLHETVRQKWSGAKEMVNQLVGYVQRVATAAGPNAPQVVEKATLHTKKVTPAGHHVFHVEQGPTSASAHVFAEVAAHHAAYAFEHTLDGGKTFVDDGQSFHADKIIENLPVGTNVGFRYRALTSKGMGDWSQVLYLVVK